MDAGQLTQRNRNQMIFAWFWDRNLFGDKQTSSSTYDVQIQRIEGADPSLERAAPRITESPPFYPLDTIVLSALDDLLTSVASTNRGPTRTSRIGYLWFFSVSSGFNWVSENGPIDGTKDTWNWTIHYPLSSDIDIFIWVVAVLTHIMPTFISGYSANEINQRAITSLGWTLEHLNTETSRVKTEGNWTDWESTWATWYADRENDGSVAAAVVPADSELPNGSQTLEVTTTTDNPNDFSDPQKWVPLKINGSKKNYLTFGWGDVLSTGLTAGQETIILEAAQAFFPGTASSATDGSDRANEIAEIVTLNASLTDTQKMIAEFWAGGPSTVSPPGMFLLFWRYYVVAIEAAKTLGYNHFFYSGLDLAIHLFETSRIVWHSKRDNFQSRPIQEIRRMYRGQTLTQYDGTSILGEAWVPYQETNFVTPPFPDFPSGHSAFSQSFANTMINWYGVSIQEKEVSMNNIRLLSPIFQDSQTNTFGTFFIPAHSSQIQPSSVPSSLLRFSYTTWQALADEAGISRKYGGIHATSAHTSSQALANSLHSALQTVWNISVS
jgi:hypothetical protein